jgi:quinol monooxygenase YgiN
MVGSADVIIMQGSIPIKSGQFDVALAMARDLVMATRDEAGCITYEFYRGLSDPDTLVIFQEWETMDALVNHLSTPHVEAFLRRLPEISDGGITTRRYLVQEVEESEAVVVVEQAPIIH